MSLVTSTWIKKINGQQKVNISDSLLLGLLTFVVVWVGLYNKQKKDGQQSQIKIPDIDQRSVEKAKNVIEQAGEITKVIKDKVTDVIGKKK